MRPRSRSALPTLAALLLAGCFGGPAATSTATPQISTPASVEPSMAPASSSPAAPSDGSATPAPSDPLAGFGCDLPIHIDATVAVTNIVDVRHATHQEGYDRIVFEFASGMPEVFVERATPPFTHDASGMPISVDGTSFLRITLRGGTKQTASGEASYTGPTDFRPGYPVLVQLVEGGDFEAQSTWYAGLSSEACVRILTLVGEGGPPRLVIDLEHG